MNIVIGVIFFWIIIVELIYWMVTGLPVSIRIIVIYRLYKWLKYNMPNTWSYHINFITTSNKRCFCTAKRKIPFINYELGLNETISYIHHYYGKVLHTDLLSNIKNIDPEFDEIQFNRDVKLHEILK